MLSDVVLHEQNGNYNLTTDRVLVQSGKRQLLAERLDLEIREEMLKPDCALPFTAGLLRWSLTSRSLSE